MARYFDDFTAYGTGSFTNNGTWQQRITTSTQTNTIPSDAGGIAGRILRIVGGTTNGSRVLSYNPAGTAANADILVRFRSAQDNSAGRRGIAYVRYSGTTEATTKGYALYMGLFSGTRGYGIVEDSTGTTVAFNSSTSLAANTWYWARLQATGTTIRAKLWSGAVTSEPAGWNISGTNGTQTTAAYHGVGTFNTGTVDYGWFSIGTNGDVPPIPLVDVTKTQLGNVRIEQTVDKNQVGNVRITQTTTQDQSGNVRITVTTDKTQQGNVRITATTDKTQSGNVRITRTTDQTQQGNVRITATTTRNQVGSVWIGAPPVLQHQVGNVSIRRTTDRTQAGNVRIQRTNAFDQLGNVRIQRTNDRTQSGNVRIQKTVDRDQTGNVAIIASATRNQIGNVRIQRTESRDQTGNVRIATEYLRTQTGNVRIQTTPLRTQDGNVRIQRTESRDQVGRVWIAVEYFKHQTGNVRIVAGRDYRIKPVVQIENIKPEMGANTTKAHGTAESITGIGASEKIKPVLMIESFDSEYVDTTVLTDDPVALADDPFALAGNLIEVGNKPDALRVVVEKGNIEVNKEKVDSWQISQPRTPALQTSTETKPSLQTTTQRVTIKSIEKLKPSLNE
jgi:hypothetical protein